MLCKYKWENSILERQQGFSYSPSLDGYFTSRVVDVTLPSASELTNPLELCCNYLKMHHLEFLLITQHLRTQASLPQLPEHPGQLVQRGLWALGNPRGASPVVSRCLTTVTLTSSGCHGDTTSVSFSE